MIEAMAHVILARMDDGQVVLMHHGDGPIFYDGDAAIGWLMDRKISDRPHVLAYQVVELEEAMRSSPYRRGRILRDAVNTAPDLIDVMVRLRAAQSDLNSAKRCADELIDRPAIAERIAELEAAVDELIEGLK